MKYLAPLVIGIFAAACGNDNATVLDAAPADGAPQVDARAVTPDAAPDAAIAIDAPGPAKVSITITSQGAPAAGIVVYFQNADSSVVASVNTDGSGNASEVMVAGGFVTAQIPEAPNDGMGFQAVNLHTFADVQPGDHLVIAEDFSGSSLINVTAPLFGGNTTDEYVLYTTCNGDTGTLLEPFSGKASRGVFVPPDCTTADVTLWDATAEQVAHATGVALTATVDLTAPGSTLTAYAAGSPIAIAYTDVPAAIKSIGVTQALISTRGVLEGYDSPTATVIAGSGAVTTGTASTSLHQATGAGTYALTVSSPDFGSAASAAQTIYDVTAAGSAYSLDVGANLVHQYTAASTFDPTTRVIAWTEDATGSAPDLSISAISIQRGDDQWDWTMAAPRNGTTVTFPQLPNLTYNYNPTVDDNFVVGQLDNLKVPGGWDAVRAHAFDSFASFASAGGTGRVIDVAPAFATGFVRHGGHAQVAHGSANVRR